MKVFKWLGISLAGLLVLAIFTVTSLLHWPLKEFKAGKVHETIVISDISVIDLKSGEIKPKQQVVLSNGIIKRITSETYSGTDAEIINGSGKYLIPGLWDMHVHSLRLFPQLNAPLYIANGVTKIRDMKGCYIDNDPLRACEEDKRKFYSTLFYWSFELFS